MPGVQTDIAKVPLVDDQDEVYSDISGPLPKYMVTRVSRKNTMWRHAFVLGGLLLLLFFVLASAFLIAGIFTSDTSNSKQVEQAPMDEVIFAPSKGGKKWDSSENGAGIIIEGEFVEYYDEDYDYEDEYDYGEDYEAEWKEWVDRYGGYVDEYSDDSYDLWNFPDDDAEDSYEYYDDDEEWNYEVTKDDTDDYYNDWYDGYDDTDYDDVYDITEDEDDVTDDDYYYAEWEEEYADWLNGMDDDDSEFIDYADADDDTDYDADSWEDAYYEDWLKDKDYVDYVEPQRDGTW